MSNNKTRRIVEWEIPQKSKRIILRVREAGSLGYTSVSLSAKELSKSIEYLEYVLEKRASKK